MNILLDNVNLTSTSGPNHFASKLKKYMKRQGSTFTLDKKVDAQLSFIQATTSNPDVPLFQRLDGIYFNSKQDFERLNQPILQTYRASQGVIFQSNFNKELTFRYFGHHSNSTVIHNGADLEFIGSIPVLENAQLDKHDNVWCCASSWRPHKRLDENIKYFLEHSSDKDCLVVAGANARSDMLNNDRIYYVGDLDIASLVSLYKRSKHFLHLAFLDHCPNVVVDAAASGCNIVCSSAGGTKEVALNGTIIQEEEWDFQPIHLYDPPPMDFTKKLKNDCLTNIDMAYVASQYNNFLGENNENNKP